MENDIKVSVFCLAYNHEKYIRQTLEGFVKQETSFRFEVIVHDDASTDKTADIIREYEKNYPDIIKPIYQEVNQYSQGTRIIRDIIFPRMRGKYVASCEGDDFWTDSRKLQLQYDALESHPECSFSSHKVKCCNEDGSDSDREFPNLQDRLQEDTVLTQDEFAQLVFTSGYLFHTSSFFYRKEVLEIPLALARDEGIIRKCILLGGCIYLCRPMSVRRLWSTGNYNSRLKAQGQAGKTKLMISNLRNDIRFNRYTSGKYASLIIPRSLSNVFSWAYSDPQLAQTVIHDYELEWKKVRKHLPFTQRIKFRFKYHLLFKHPKGLVFLFEHQEKSRIIRILNR